MRKKRDVYLLTIIFLFAFTIRMMMYSSIFVGNNVRFLEFDPFYHMRRAVSFAENFPRIWDFDTYINFPYGDSVGWPPLYDWTIALIANILGLGHPSIHLIETVGVFFPAILGALSCVVIYFVCDEIFKNYKEDGKDIGLMSGVLLAIIPGFVQVSFLGFVDHHVAEVLLSLTMYLFILKALNSDKKEEQRRFILIFFVVLILAALTWPGTPIFIGIILIFLILQTILEKRFKYFYMIILFLLLSVAGLYVLFPSTFEFLMRGINFLTREGPVMHQIVEAQPLFYTFQGIFTLEPSWYAFNTALYIAILGFIGLIISIINFKGDKFKFKDDKFKFKDDKFKFKDDKFKFKDDKFKKFADEYSGKNFAEKRALVFFLVWTIIVMILNLYQTRFVYLFAVNIVILCSFAITYLLRKDKDYLKIIGMILLIIIIVPSGQTVNTMITHPLMLSNDWFTSLEWLKQNSPNPGNYIEPAKGQIPNYGVMEWWDYGNYILYLSQRPVIANNFQLGIEDSTNFFASENESDANNIMNQRKARYVIVDYRLGLNPYNSGNRAYLRGAWISLAVLLNKDLSYYLDKNNFPNDKYLSTMYSKLYLFDGKGLKNYKLIYKSPTNYTDLFGRPSEEIKIFEYIANTNTTVISKGDYDGEQN